MDPQLEIFSQTIAQLIERLIAFLPSIIASLVIFLIALYFAGVLSRALRQAMVRRKADPEIVLLVGQIARWAVVVLGTIAALNQVGFNVTAFLTGLGVIGFTVGFAIQDVSKNFVAGLLLLIMQPFDIGDTIEVVGFTGKVLDVDLRATDIRTLDGRRVQIPNADIFTSPIVNYSRAAMRRVELSTGVAYGTDLERARRLALESLSAVDGVLDVPAPKVVFDNLGASTVDMIMYYWVDTAKVDILDAKDMGILNVENTFAREKVEMPFPTQTVLVRNE